MTFRSLNTAALIVIAALPAYMSAQLETTGKEEERLAAIARSAGEWQAPKNKISVGFRVLNSGGQVDFSNLGIVPTIRNIAPIEAGAAQRTYDNGTVYLDALRPDERNEDGTQFTVPGGRYQITLTAENGTEFINEDLLSYTPGYTREWEVITPNQFDRPGYASFNLYSATSAGGTATNKQGPSGGVEFQLSRDIGRTMGNFQWGMVAGIALNDINSKAAGTVASNLNIHTDYYAYNTDNGQPTPSGIYYSINQFIALLDINGVQVNPFGVENTALLSAVSNPALSTDTVIAGAANVAGTWQVKGAYFLFKFGPSLHTRITDRLGVTASLGLAGAYAGTRYSAHEYFTNPDAADQLIQTDDPISSSATKFLKGYYADVNLEFIANDTLGIFGGFTAQQLTDYEQKLGDRVAKIDLGSAVGFRGGVSIRF